MTNEQLYIFITQLHDRLRYEIHKLRQQLPDDLDKHPGIMQDYFMPDTKPLSSISVLRS